MKRIVLPTHAISDNGKTETATWKQNNNPQDGLVSSCDDGGGQ
jgi:hypothetical protein